MPGKLYRSRRQRRRKVKWNEASSCSSNGRLGKDSNAHPFRDQRTYDAHIPTLKDDVWKKASLLRQIPRDAQRGFIAEQ